MPTGTITAIRQQSNDPQRVNIFIDGEFALGISLNTLVRERLAVGVQLDEAAWERLVASEQADQALQKALQQLERRPRSTAEMRRYLQRKGFDEATCTRVMARLHELGLLNDADFARRWVANRRALRPRGDRALRAELRHKGIAPAIIDEALAAEDDGMSERERAEAVARAVLPRYAQVADWAAFQRRFGGYLLRRGFAADLIRPILVHLWRELHPGEDRPDW